MPKKVFTKVFFTSSQEQSTPVMESATSRSLFKSIRSANGSKIKVFDEVFRTFFAIPNLTSFAAVHFFGSSCLNINTSIRITNMKQKQYKKLPKIYFFI